MLDCFVACDLETTGTDPQRDEVIEVCLLKVRGGRVVDRLATLVRPRGPIPPAIERLTGITDGMLAGAPDWSDVLPRVRAFLDGLPLLGHNVGFDASFLRRLGVDVCGPLLDTATLARIVMPAASSYRLQALCRLLDISRETEHRAAPDALAAVNLFLALRNLLASFAPDLLRRVADLLRRGRSPWAEFFTGTAVEATEDTLPGRCAAAAGDEEADGPGTPFTFSEEEVVALLGGGALGRTLPNYEYRPQQLAVARAVARALESRRHLLVEAGTGTGKSLAYLVPAALWSLSTGERVVISTHTISLQDQLLRKDIPLVQRVVARPLRAALLKGRQHYLCLRRWEAAVSRAELSPAAAHFYARLMVWRELTRSGDVGEMHLTREERELWTEVRADPEGCGGPRCHQFASCFVTRARRSAERAHLVVTNHALLLSDIRDGGLLPPYGPLVLDEAHHLEDVATSLFGYQVPAGELMSWLAAVEHAVVRRTREEGWHRQLSEATAAAAAFFATLGEAARATSSPDTCEVRLAPGAANLDPDGYIAAAFTRLVDTLDGLLEALRGRLRASEEAGAQGDGPAAGEEVARLVENGHDLLARLELIYGNEDPRIVAWVEAEPQRPEECILRAAPVEVGDILYEHLFSCRGPVILTSATLTSEGSFAFFKERTGLDRVPPEKLMEVAVDSPFPLQEQALVCVVNDIPEPPPGDTGPYVSVVSSCIQELAEVAPGKMLVLFTAHRLLQKVYARLHGVLTRRGITVLGHGIDGSRSRLLEEFNALERAVLLGAATFWEGVDLPGDALQCVVLVRLPFAPPGTPLVEARQEFLRQRGGDHFARLAVPQAVLRFKQGFGRLIRTRQDRGVMVVLDPRLLTRHYGRKFLASLPPLHVYAAPVKDVARAVAVWLRDGTFCDSGQ